MKRRRSRFETWLFLIFKFQKVVQQLSSDEMEIITTVH